jgi:tetratricopeptide (TPR) repeat protein
MSKLFNALVVLLLITTGSNAQNYNLEAKTDTFYFRFFFSEESAEPYPGYFSHGSLSIKPFSEGKVYPLYSEYVTDLDESHGVATVSSSEVGTSGLSVRLSASPDGRRIFQQLEGIVAFSVEITNNKYQSLFYHMVRNDIYLFDIFNGQPFYTMEGVMDDDSPKKEEIILQAMLREAKFVAEEMVKQGMEAPKVTSGRFEGLDLFEAMKKSSLSDIRSFLRYVKLRPRKFQGINWQFAEVYATWIDGGAPSTNEDVEQLLIENIENFKNFRKYLSSYHKKDYPLLAKMLRDKAGELKRENESLEAAMDYANLSLKVSETAEDIGCIAWAYFEIAEIQQEQALSEKAIQSYYKSIEYFELTSEKTGLVSAYNNLGRTLNQQKNKAGYSDALKWLNKGVALRGSLGSSEASQTVLALLYRNLGDSHAGLKKYKKAIEVYESGLTYTKSDSPLSLKRRSILYIQMADVYEKLNKMDESKEYTRKGVMTFKHYEEVLAKQTKT